MAEELQQLKKEIDTRDRIIAQLKTSQNGNQNSGGASSHWNPETLKEKAKRVVHLAREQAELHRRKADLELDQLKKEIRKLKEEKTNLIQ
ncbi:MAG: hypothetical protein GWM98_03220, partial [Nitrospinaceae bacterium]|nr:hypothetical protein [Nitrospinaceae bacterium]NIR53702.1 hypothetical protein [Nitrospinaceae bacterium]NIS84110.1 hypothetical protein [Nitrospinaceae bacterium]NIT80910.1 hypothetical protein [Nitrospinaceae bacterium]NIU43208.1 hypothetical protein [Nitrospinaceae bacterium]